MLNNSLIVDVLLNYSQYVNRMLILQIRLLLLRFGLILDAMYCMLEELT